MCCSHSGWHYRNQTEKMMDWSHLAKWHWQSDTQKCVVLNSFVWKKWKNSFFSFKTNIWFPDALNYHFLIQNWDHQSHQFYSHLKLWMLKKSHMKLPLQKCLEIFFYCLMAERRSTGIQWVEAKDTAKYPTKHRTVTQNKICLVHSAAVDNPYHRVFS